MGDSCHLRSASASNLFLCLVFVILIAKIQIHTSKLLEMQFSNVIKLCIYFFLKNLSKCNTFVKYYFIHCLIFL